MNVTTPSSEGGRVVTLVVDRLCVDCVRELVAIFDSPRPGQHRRLEDYVKWAMARRTDGGEQSAEAFADVLCFWKDLTPDQAHAMAMKVVDFWHENTAADRAKRNQPKPKPALKIVVSNANTVATATKPKRTKATARPALAAVQTGGAA